MALVKCPECDKNISDKAESCPHCGYSFEKKANNNLFEPQPLHFQVKRDTPATKPQKERLYRLAEQHKITLEVDVEKLTRSEASRLADKILAKYGR